MIFAGHSIDVGQLWLSAQYRHMIKSFKKSDDAGGPGDSIPPKGPLAV